MASNLKRLNSNLIGVDTETTGLKAYAGARVFAYSCADISGATFYAEDDAFPRHLVGTDKWTGDFSSSADNHKGPVRDFMRSWMGDPTITKVLQNAKFDIKMMRKYGIEIKGKVHDTMIMGHVLGAQGEAGPKWQENCSKRLKLENLAKKYLNNEKIDKVKLWLKDNKRKFVQEFDREPNFSDVPLEIMEEYSRMDPFLTVELFHVFWPNIQKDPDLLATYEREMELMWHIIDMEDRGFLMDVPFMDKRIKELTDSADKASKVLMTLAPAIKVKKKKPYTRQKVKYHKWVVHTIQPKDMNFNSDDQMLKIVYGHFKQPVLHWTGLEPGESAEGKTADQLGQPSLDERTLSRLNHPFCQELIRYRQYAKCRDTYYVGYKSHMRDGILHPNYHQCGTQTGRLSASDPNLQNIPMEQQVRERANADVIYKGVKRAFIPRPGFVNMHFDYSGIEMRMFANFVGTDQVIRGVTESDLHDWATELLFGITKKTATKEEFEYKRVLAKIMNFGILYGMGKKTFAWKLQKTLPEVDELLNLYYAKLPEVKDLQQQVIQEIQQTGMIKNGFGRRYVIDPRYAYKGVNYLCQGSAADILKTSMIRVGNYLRAKKSNMLMSIHDEIVCEVHLSEIHYVPRNIVRMMEYQPRFKVPLKVSAEVAAGNWENLKKLSSKDLEELCTEKLSLLLTPQQR